MSQLPHKKAIIITGKSDDLKQEAFSIIRSKFDKKGTRLHGLSFNGRKFSSAAIRRFVNGVPSENTFAFILGLKGTNQIFGLYPLIDNPTTDLQLLIVMDGRTKAKHLSTDSTFLRRFEIIDTDAPDYKLPY